MTKAIALFKPYVLVFKVSPSEWFSFLLKQASSEKNLSFSFHFGDKPLGGDGIGASTPLLPRTARSVWREGVFGQRGLVRSFLLLFVKGLALPCSPLRLKNLGILECIFQIKYRVSTALMRYKGIAIRAIENNFWTTLNSYWVFAETQTYMKRVHILYIITSPTTLHFDVWWGWYFYNFILFF